MIEQHTQITEIDDIVFPTVVAKDALGVTQDPDKITKPQKSGFLDDLEELEGEESSLTNDNPTGDAEEEEEGTDEPLATDVDPDVEKQPAGETKPDSNHFKDTLKNLYGEDLTIVQEVDGQEVETNLDDIEIDSETFAEIIRSRTEQEIKEATRDKISLEGASDFTKQLIEIESRNGNVTELLKLKEMYIDPLQGIDLETAEGQKEILSLYYKANGRPDEEADRLIRTFELDGVLEDRATDAEVKIRSAVDNQAEQVKQATIQAEEQRKEVLKQYRKTVKETFSKKYEFNEKVISKLADSATKVDEATKKVGIVVKYQEMMANPDLAVDLILFLNDKEEYDKQVSKAKVFESQIKTANRVKVMKTTGTNVEIRKQQKSDEDNFVPVVVG